MSLRRVGFTTFAVGLFVGAVLLVLGPVVSGSPPSCPGRLPSFAVEGVRAWPPRVFYATGCGSGALDPSFAVAFLLALLGLLLSGVGFARDPLGPE